MASSNDRTRDGRGRFRRNIDTAERDTEAARLRARGQTYEQIAAALNFSDKSNAKHAVDRALRDTQQDASDDVRKFELTRLDDLWRAALKVLETEHVTVSHGHVIRREVGRERDEEGELVLDGDGKPIPIYEDLIDDAPVLQAVDRLLKIQARRAALLGLDTPVKADVTVHQVDPADLALAEILREARAKNAAEEAQLKGDL